MSYTFILKKNTIKLLELAESSKEIQYLFSKKPVPLVEKEETFDINIISDALENVKNEIKDHKSSKKNFKRKMKFLLTCNSQDVEKTSKMYESHEEMMKYYDKAILELKKIQGFLTCLYWICSCDEYKTITYYFE